MAPEIICGQMGLASRADLKKMDVWSFAMVLFVLLNPDFHYPYQTELKKYSTITGMLPHYLKNVMEKHELPQHSIKYKDIREKAWPEIMRIYEDCAKFKGRPAMNEVVNLMTINEARYVPF